MNPTNSSQGGDELGPTRSVSPQITPPPSQQTAAANVIRTQIDALYGDNIVAHTSPNIASAQQANTHETQPAQGLDADNIYNRTHSDHPQPQADQWKAYHSAWQTYYQKYYEAYYHHKNAQEAVAKQQVAATATHAGFFSSQPEPTPQPEPVISEEEITKDQAIFELRQKLLGKVKTRATKIRRSRHFIPIAAALCVVMIFAFLQYNRVILATVSAYVSPGSVDVQNIVIDPTSNNAVSQDPRLIIPKINVDVPAIYGVGADHNSQMAAMEKGVAHFGIPGANSRPGEIGNTVLSGHSSNDLFDQGDYKFIFAQLEKLKEGDTIYANYEGIRYTYVVTKMEVVLPTEVGKLIYPTDKPVMTLITCTPLGTAQKRLLVTAEQVSPDPGQATAAPAGSGSADAAASADMPGTSPTLIERLFGAR